MFKVMYMEIEFNEQELRKVLDEIIKEIADKLAETIRRNITKMGAVASGYMLRSVYVRKVDDAEYEVGVEAPYSIYVEYGTKPRERMPPVEAIKNWLITKFRMSEREASKAAWAIAKKIQKEGTEPKPFFRSAIDEVVNKYGGL